MQCSGGTLADDALDSRDNRVDHQQPDIAERLGLLPCRRFAYLTLEAPETPTSMATSVHSSFFSFL
jgi:hypothetical protein